MQWLGSTAAVESYGRWCAAGLRGQGARVARRAGVRDAGSDLTAPEQNGRAAFLCERRGFRGGAAAQYRQQRSAPRFRLRARNRAPPRGMVRRRLTPKFSRMRRRRNSPPRRSLAPHVGCNATLGFFGVITLVESGNIRVEEPCLSSLKLRMVKPAVDAMNLEPSVP